PAHGLGMAEAVADARLPGGRYFCGIEEGLEQADAAEPDLWPGDVVDGEGPAGEGQDLIERLAGIGLAEEFQPRLLVFDRLAVVLAEDGAKIGVRGGYADQLVLEVLLGDRQGEIGPQAILDAIVGRGQQELAAELLAGQIEERSGGQQQRRADPRHGARLDETHQRCVALGGRSHLLRSREALIAGSSSRRATISSSRHSNWPGRSAFHSALSVMALAASLPATR